MNDADVWRVLNYADSVSAVSVGSSHHSIARYFDTEAEAHAFIVDRAELNVKQAEVELAAARRRLKKCQKKFAPTVEPSVEPPK